MIGSQATPTTPPAGRMTVHDIESAVTQLRALEWLTRQPLDRLPLMVWFAHEDGGLIGTPADTTQARHAFEQWARHLRLTPDPPRRRGGLTRLRAQGRVDGILVTLHAECRGTVQGHAGSRPSAASPTV